MVKVIADKLKFLILFQLVRICCLLLFIGSSSEGQHDRCDIKFKPCLILKDFVSFSLMVVYFGHSVRVRGTELTVQTLNFFPSGTSYSSSYHKLTISILAVLNFCCLDILVWVVVFFCLFVSAQYLASIQNYL